MGPMYITIRQKETGSRIKGLLTENGYTVKDVQSVMGFENPQAVYKWMSGKSLPSIDNFIILSRLLHTSIEDILVIDGDTVFLIRRPTYGNQLLTQQTGRAAGRREKTPPTRLFSKIFYDKWLQIQRGLGYTIEQAIPENVNLDCIM